MRYEGLNNSEGNLVSSMKRWHDLDIDNVEMEQGYASIAEFRHIKKQPMIYKEPRKSIIITFKEQKAILTLTDTEIKFYDADRKNLYMKKMHITYKKSNLDCVDKILKKKINEYLMLEEI